MNSSTSASPIDASDLTYQQIIDLKRRIRAEAIEPYLVNPENAELRPRLAEGSAILDVDDIEVLQGLIKSGQYSAEEVILTYARRAATIQEKTNSLTEVLFDEALNHSRELDKILKNSGQCIGPLHGIPVTVKDQFNVRGKDTTLGYVGRAFQPATEDAILVEIMKQLGAIILCKTNLPQSIMWCETENPLFGLTTNPRNPDFTPGGSTGGEGNLLAMHGSLVGWGTDIGGSVRIPSHINGLYGFKPTSSRLPYRGVPVSTEGQEHVPSSIGTMTRSLSSVITIMKAVIGAEPWNLDPRCVPLTWRDDRFLEPQNRSLTIGVIADDGVVRPHPPIARVMREIRDKLIAAGHELVHWEPTDHHELIEIMDLYYTADGGEDIRRDVEKKGEPYIPHVENIINRGKAISVYEYWQLNRRKIAAQSAYNDRWVATRGPLSGRRMDAILMPTMPHPAVPHRGCKWVGYTKVWNILDYPAISIPAGHVSKDLDSSQEHQPRNELDAWNWKLYNPVTMHGHPIGLQLVTRRFEEEKLLGIAKVLDGLLGDSRQRI